MKWLIAAAAIGGAIAISRRGVAGLGHMPEPFSWYTDEQFMDELRRRATRAAEDAISLDDNITCDEARRLTLVAMDSLKEARSLSRHARFPSLLKRFGSSSEEIRGNLDVAIDLIQGSIKWYEQDCGAWTGPRP